SRTHRAGLITLPASTPPSLLWSFFFQCHGAPRHLHSFPTRRSSDLAWSAEPGAWPRGRSTRARGVCGRCQRGGVGRRAGIVRTRSEEHTSELQSRFDLVCRLLLEKKKFTQSETLDRSTGKRRQSMLT